MAESALLERGGQSDSAGLPRLFFSSPLLNVHPPLPTPITSPARCATVSLEDSLGQGRSQPASEPHCHWSRFTSVTEARPATGYPPCVPAPPPPPSRLSPAPCPARPAASSRSSWAGTALGLFKVCESLHNLSVQLNVLSEPSGRCSRPPAAPALGAPLSMAGWLYSSRCALLPHLASRGNFPSASLCPQAATAWARPRAASCRLPSSPSAVSPL